MSERRGWHETDDFLVRAVPGPVPHVEPCDPRAPAAGPFGAPLGAARSEGETSILGSLHAAGGAAGGVAVALIALAIGSLGGTAAILAAPAGALLIRVSWPVAARPSGAAD